MKKVKSNLSSTDILLQESNELMKKQLIINLAQMKVSNHVIRKIVGCDMNYVTNILKPLKINS